MDQRTTTSHEGSPIARTARWRSAIGAAFVAALGAACTPGTGGVDAGAPLIDGGVTLQCSPGLPEYVVGPLHAEIAGGVPGVVAFIDIDQDGDLDVLGAQAQFAVLLNDGSGSLTPPRRR